MADGLGQKMKCEISEGTRKCKHCVRRKLCCSLEFAKPSRPIRQDVSTSAGVVGEAYEHKIDLMRDEIRHVRRTLDALVNQTIASASPSLATTQRGYAVNDSPSTTRTDPARLSVHTIVGREENMQMAMTRENSADPDHLSNGDVAVEEPMSSLYEVTRLRNIRSNQAKTVRPPQDGGTELNDIISREIITESEAQELYIT